MNKNDYIKTCVAEKRLYKNLRHKYYKNIKYIYIFVNQKKYIIYIKNYKIKIKNQRWDLIINKNHYKNL